MSRKSLEKIRENGYFTGKIYESARLKIFVVRFMVGVIAQKISRSVSELAFSSIYGQICGQEGFQTPNLYGFKQYFAEQAVLRNIVVFYIVYISGAGMMSMYLQKRTKRWELFRQTAV